jgi:alkylation response protein AidB-like acyl-CoA dehydrogenase
MNLEFSDEQKLVQKTARGYLTEHATLAVCRQVLESGEPYSKDLWKGMCELGWLGAAIPEAYGGSGFGYLELVLIAQELGRALAPVPFTSSIYLAAEAILAAGDERQKKVYLRELASGQRIGTFALAEGPGDFDPANAETVFDGSTVTGTKLPVPDGDSADLAVVVAREGASVSLVLVDLHQAGVKTTRLAAFDPSRPQAKLELRAAQGERLGARGDGARLASAILDRAAVLLGYEQIGGAERALDLTRSYTMSRFAFGRPIASFQALKHRMVEVFAQTELALSNAYWAAWALTSESDELPVAAAALRVAASDAFTLASEELIQMHGGVGYTWEYDCHLFYRRARALASAIGSPSEWRDHLVTRVDARL